MDILLCSGSWPDRSARPDPSSLPTGWGTYIDTQSHKAGAGVLDAYVCSCVFDARVKKKESSVAVRINPRYVVDPPKNKQ